MKPLCGVDAHQCSKHRQKACVCVCAESETTSVGEQGASLLLLLLLVVMYRTVSTAAGQEDVLCKQQRTHTHALTSSQ